MTWLLVGVCSRQVDRVNRPARLDTLYGVHSIPLNDYFSCWLAVWYSVTTTSRALRIKATSAA